MGSLLWVLASGLIVLGVPGTVRPVLAGTVLVLAGVVLAAWLGLLAGMLAKVVLASIAKLE